MAKLRDRDLERFFDGELSPRHRRAVSAQLEKDEIARRKLVVLESTRDLVREAVLDEEALPSFEKLYAGIRTGIARDGAAAAAPSLGALDLVRTWLRRYRLVVASAVAAGALAFGLVHFVVESPVHNQCDIESIDNGPGVTSTIFTPNDPDDSSDSTVIWIDDDNNGGGEGGSI
jgi:hypothetical protein